MKITIDTNNLSELDVAMLGFLAEQEPSAEAETEVEPDPEPVAAKKVVAKKVAAVVEPEPEPEEEEEIEEDLVGGDAPTISDAVAAATKLVSEGKQAVVKAALTAVGAKKVSEMEADVIPSFLAALEAE